MTEVTVKPLRSFLFERTLKTAKSKPFPAPRATALQLKEKGLVQIVGEKQESEISAKGSPQGDDVSRRGRKPKGGSGSEGE